MVRLSTLPSPSFWYRVLSMDADAADSLHDGLDALAGEVEVWLQQMTQLASALRQLQAAVSPGEFEAWGLATYDMDAATLYDFMRFDGTLSSVTDRMLACCQRIVSTLN